MQAQTRSPLPLSLLTLLLFSAAPLVSAQDEGAETAAGDWPVLDLPEFVTREARVANLEPAETFAAPVSQLRYEPLVDVQARNFAEGQADVTIRGGIFENTGFKLGAVTLFDPQTGHYFAEIPVDPAMVTVPEILTGVENAVAGFNSAVGTISYDWKPMESGGAATLGFGDNDLNFQRFRIAEVATRQVAGRNLGVEFSYARSESDGTREFSDHQFHRYNGRIQLRDETSQTDIFAGYLHKILGGVSLYAAPFGSPERDNIKTELYYVNHRQNYGVEGSFFEVGGYHRRLRNDYDFSRFVPNNDFEHTTEATALGLGGRHVFSTIWALNYGGQFMTDEIESTNLESGLFVERDYAKLSLLPERRFELDNGDTFVAELGASFDDSDQDESEVSPLARLSLLDYVGEGLNRYYVSYAQTTQVPGYTILGGSRTSGLFRGNPTAGREISHNVEGGVEVDREDWRAHAAVFYRRDNDLQDWTYDFDLPPFAGTVARTANPVDIDTYGFEGAYFRKIGDWDMVLGYIFLEKDEDYGVPGVDGSFYALNHAKHRATFAVVYHLTESIEIRGDNQYRVMEDNPLRTSDDDALLSALGVSWFPLREDRRLEIHAQVDNLFKTDFEEIPGTPGGLRQVAVGATYRW